MRPVIVYSTPNCQKCRLTAMRMDKKGIPYTKVDVTRDPEAFARVKAWGYKVMPVVEAGTEHWSDYRMDRIDALAMPTEKPVKELKRDAVVQDRDVVEDKG